MSWTDTEMYRDICLSYDSTQVLNNSGLGNGNVLKDIAIIIKSHSHYQRQNITYVNVFHEIVINIMRWN